MQCPQTSRMLLDVTHSFLALEPKHQDALIRLVRALAADAEPFAGGRRRPLSDRSEILSSTAPRGAHSTTTT